MLSSRPVTGVWDDPMYLKEKEKIMMCYDDAKNCTFQPAVGSRTVNAYKNFMKTQCSEFLELPHDYFDKNKKFSKFIEKMGPNFKFRSPKLYKLGILKKVSLAMKSEQNYEEAYKLLRRNFNVEQIKKHFLGAKYF